MLRVEEVDEVIDCVPTQCKHCQAQLQGIDSVPQRHQVAELPKAACVTVEYQLHKLKCSSCKRNTRGSLPDGVSWSRFGPRLKGAVCTLTGQYRLSKDNVVALLSDFFGLSISPGSISAIERQAKDLLAAHYDEALAFARGSDVAHMDETGWRMERHTSWLWTLVAEPVRVFCVCDERNGAIAKELLEGFDGVLVSDRYGAYSWYDKEKHQFCWAHLRREFKAMSARTGELRIIGDQLLRKTDKLFEIWHKIRDGTLERDEGLEEIEVVREGFEPLLERGGQVCAEPYGGMCRNLFAHSTSLWTFTRYQGVEPTNNVAERALRHGVIWRKTSFGNDSVVGGIFTERILTVAQTLRAQARNVLDFIFDVFDAHLRGAPTPKLLLQAA